MVPTTDSPGRARRGDHPQIALAVVVACQLMVVIDATVVNIALPQIQGDLRFSAADLAWVLNAYTLTFGGLLLLGGRAGDLFGRRRVFVAGVVLFTIASLVGGLATAPAALLAARALQGVGAAVAAPSVLALIATTFDEGHARNRALGIFTGVSAAGGSIGLILGGVLTAAASWRWVLWINVPVGVAIVILAPLYLHETERRRGALDVRGAVCATAGLGSLVYAFVRAAADGWDDRVAEGAVALAVALLVALPFAEARATQPVLPLRLLAHRTRAAAYVTYLLLAGALFAMFFFLTQYLQDVLGYSPLRAGLAFLPLTIALFTCSRIVPRLVPRLGPKPLVVAGATMLVAGLGWLTQLSATSEYLSAVLGPLTIFGIGGGITFMPLSALILGGVARDDAGAAAGLLQTVQQVGGALGIAALVAIAGTTGARVDGIARAFGAGAALAAAALLLAVLAIGRPRPPAAATGDPASA